MSKVAIVVSSPLKNGTLAALQKYNDVNVKLDMFYLSSEPKDKILKKDVDLDFSHLDEYDIVCPIGADGLKHVCKMTGITKYNGVLVDDKYLPILDPAMVLVKPQYESDIKKAFNKLQSIIEGETVLVSHKFFRHYTLEDIHSFEEYLEKLEASDLIAVDVETDSLSPRQGSIIGFAFSTHVDEGVYVDPEVIEHYFDRLDRVFKTTKCVFHNAKFDIAFIKRDFGFEFPDFEDTLLLHYCLDESVGTHGLKQLALKFTDLGDYERELDEYKKTWARENKVKLADFNYSMIPSNILSLYACKDGCATKQLFHKFMPLVEKNEQFYHLYRNILMPALKTIMHMEDVGGPISISALDDIIEDYKIDIEETIAEISLDPAVIKFERTNEKTFNPNSIYHLREVLFNILGLQPLKKTEKGENSTDAEVLSKLDHPLAEAVLDLRKKVKLSQTYLKNIRNGVDFDNRLRSSFNLTGTTSGRLSSSGVLNYQNLPRDKDSGIKKIFKAEEDYSIVQCDLGTAEVYVAAALSNDKFLKNAFINKLDFHSYVAKAMFKLDCEVHEVKELYADLRQYSKAITFGILYGAGPTKISETANISVPEAKEFIKLYFSQAKNLKQWIDESLNFIHEHKFIYSIFGRKRRLPEVGSPNRGVAGHAARSGLNFLIQSVASDINLLGLTDLVEWVNQEGLKDEIRVFATVHDSIVAEVKNEYLDIYVDKVKYFLQKDRGVYIEGCPISVDVEVGSSWGELRGYETK